MNIEEFREYCLTKPGTTEELPFDEDTLVFKVAGKMYALCSISEFNGGITLKCEPALAIELRELYDQVQPGYHMSKIHWITVLPEAGIPNDLLVTWIDNSYALVAGKLPKNQRQALGLL